MSGRKYQLFVPHCAIANLFVGKDYEALDCLACSKHQLLQVQTRRELGLIVRKCIVFHRQPLAKPSSEAATYLRIYIADFGVDDDTKAFVSWVDLATASLNIDITMAVSTLCHLLQLLRLGEDLQADTGMFETLVDWFCEELERRVYFFSNLILYLCL